MSSVILSKPKYFSSEISKIMSTFLKYLLVFTIVANFNDDIINIINTSSKPFKFVNNISRPLYEAVKFVVSLLQSLYCCSLDFLSCVSMLKI